MVSNATRDNTRLDLRLSVGSEKKVGGCSACPELAEFRRISSGRLCVPNQKNVLGSGGARTRPVAMKSPSTHPTSLVLFFTKSTSRQQQEEARLKKGKLPHTPQSTPRASFHLQSPTTPQVSQMAARPSGFPPPSGRERPAPRGAVRTRLHAPKVCRCVTDCAVPN